MSERGNIVWGWALAICVVVITAALVLPLLARSTNCGGNTAALSACRSVVVGLQEVALDRGDKPFRVANLSATERENFRIIHGMSWLPGARVLLISEQINILRG